MELGAKSAAYLTRGEGEALGLQVLPAAAELGSRQITVAVLSKPVSRRSKKCHGSSADDRQEIDVASDPERK